MITKTSSNFVSTQFIGKLIVMCYSAICTQKIIVVDEEMIVVVLFVVVVAVEMNYRGCCCRCLQFPAMEPVVFELLVLESYDRLVGVADVDGLKVVAFQAVFRGCCHCVR